MQTAENAQQHNGPHLLTIDEIIEAARSSRATVYREIKAGRLKTIKLGSRRYSTPEYMREWFEALASGDSA